MIQPGTRLGSYEIEAAIGAGGMGEVYRARDTRLNRAVAIKVLPAALASDRDRIARFTREAQTLAALNHPHIAHIYGIDESSSAPALIMELVEGETLADRVARGPLALDDALPIAAQIAEALEAAHEAGIIHRDLKPANVKVRPDGTVKVLDFGLAKAFVQNTSVDTESRSPLNSPTITSPAFTQAGIILGTAAYMSPEQARGKAVDKRADIWAFGCVLYEMLTARPPFPGDTITDVIAAVVKNDPDWTALPAATPRRVRRTLARCLRKDPLARLRDIGDARLELMGVDADIAEAVPVSAPRGRPAGLLVAIALAALSIGLLVGMQLRKPAVAGAPRWTGVLVGGPAIVMQPALSPDGQLLAFQTMVDGQSQVAVMTPDAGTWRVLTSDRTRGLMVIHDWSPDGSRIFYDRQTDTLNGVFAVPALGGDERLILDNAGFPAVLPTGDLLVQRVNASRQLQLHRFSPSTGRLDPLPAIVDSAQSDDAVLPSADGRTVYFYGQPLDQATLPSAFYQMDLASRQIERLANVNLRAPVSLAVNRATADVLVGGLDGDSFQILRLSAQTNGMPDALLSIPHAARFDVHAKGALYVAVRSRISELFAFTPAPAATAGPTRLDTLPSMNTRQLQTLAPLPDGRVLIGSRAGDHDRMLVIHSGRQPTLLVEGDEETRPPATAVGAEHAAVMMGPATSPDIAIVNTADGRLVRRFKAPSTTILTLEASPEGRTLYYTDGGSVWSVSADGGTPTRLGAGDSLTVDRESGELIVKLDEGARIRLVRMTPDGRTVQDIPVQGALRLIPRPLVPGGVRQGRLAIAVASADSWFWHAALLDLKTGVVTKLAEVNPSDFHFVTWRSDGVPIGLGYGLDTALWRYTSRPQ